MPYEKQTWIDLETPLDAEHMNHIEDGIAENDSAIGRLSEEMAKKEKPLVYIDGAIPTTKDNVLAEMRVVSSWLNFHAYIKIKCQGTSSMAHPKKNFTVTLYQDEARTIPLYITIPGWKHASNKFVLKADWVDATHSLNVVTANIWSDVVAYRPDYDSLPEELRNSPNNGAIDGFPIIVCTNGTYQGVYNWSIGKEAWMWGMDEDNPNHVLLCGEKNTDGVYAETACNFRALWSGIHEDMWSYEVGTKGDAVKNSFNTLISCVKDTERLSSFKASISNYLDVNGAIDYHLVGCAICGLDNFGKNMLAATYDLVKWRLGMYDLDLVWGNGHGGKSFVSANFAYPEQYQEPFSLLFERIQAAFWQEVKARGEELRKGPLSYANVVSKFERYVDTIGAEAYKDDLIPYPDIPSADANNIWRIRNFVRDRLAYFDAWLEAIPETVECTGISLSASELTFNSVGTQALTLTVSPSNANEKITWATTNKNVATVSGGTVTAVGDGSAEIIAMCGRNVARCAVTVSGISAVGGVLYRLSEPKSIATAEDIIDTGVVLLDAEKSFTIAADFTPNAQTTDPRTFFTSTLLSDPWNSMSLLTYGEEWEAYYCMGVDSGEGGVVGSSNKTNIPKDTSVRSAFIVRYEMGSNALVMTSFNGTEKAENTYAFPAGGTIFAGDGVTNLWIGASDAWTASPKKLWSGVVNRFIVYDHALTDEEVTAFIDGMTD